MSKEPLLAQMEPIILTTLIGKKKGSFLHKYKESHTPKSIKVASLDP